MNIPELFSLFIQHSPIYAYIKSVKPDESRVIFASENFKDMIGISGTEIIGKTMADLFSPEFAEKITADDWKVVSEGKILNVEETLNNRNYITIKFPIVQGSLKLMAGYTIDISERKLSEELLQKSEEKYRSLFNSMSEGFCLHEIIYNEKGQPSNYRILDANLAYENILGIKKQDAIGKKATEVYHVKEPPFLEAYSKVALSGESIHFETYFAHMQRSFSITVFSPVKGKFATIFEDITERKMAESNLRTASDRLSLAISSVKLGIWDWNVRDNFMTWDARMFELYGITQASCTQTIEDWENALHPEDKKKALEECNLALSGIKDFNTTFRICHPDGKIVYIKADGKVIRDHEGKATRMIGINRDITDQKRMEEELRKAQKLESLGILAGGIAHDFNNLLSGFFGYLSLADSYFSHNQIENGRRKLKESISLIEQIKSLSNQLMTFSKGGAPVRKVINLSPLIKSICEFTVTGSNVSCQYDIDPDLNPCNCDGNQINQAISNIIINAKQAMPSGGQILISAKNILLKPEQFPDHQGNFLMISIKDSGSGIPKEIMNNIFDPFFSTKET